MTRVFDASTDVVCLDIAVNVSLHIRPGVIVLNKCDSAILFRMTGNDYIMMGIEDVQAH